jgi:deazaflavin-dependent oxidoreductase (nitroreductase family)
MPEPPREYRRGRADRIGDAVFALLARAGVGPVHLLTTRGRRTGQPRTNPVVLVRRDRRSWLVAPYGAVPWVLNARAAGRVRLRRGRDDREYEVREVTAAEAGPILKSYVAVATATRPYFRAAKDSPEADFAAEAHLHPVFELIPADGR